ncbi:hypothetical protein GQR58_011845 [Nymphon striatum]|nr:hypothetical protein GQR58_011845 [Nymphon striatum]
MVQDTYYLLSDKLYPRWENWKTDLTNLKQITVPRCYFSLDFTPGQKIQVHHFLDASLKGYGMCSYLRVQNQEKQYSLYACVRKTKSNLNEGCYSSTTGTYCYVSANKFCDKKTNQASLADFFLQIKNLSSKGCVSGSNKLLHLDHILIDCFNLIVCIGGRLSNASVVFISHRVIGFGSLSAHHRGWMRSREVDAPDPNSDSEGVNEVTKEQSPSGSPGNRFKGAAQLPDAPDPNSDSEGVNEVTKEQSPSGSPGNRYKEAAQLPDAPDPNGDSKNVYWKSSYVGIFQ